MTAPQVERADLLSGANGRPLGAGRTAPTLLSLLLLGLLLRLTIAYVLLPGSGFSTDVATFTAWAMTLAEHGPGLFYETAGFADYPPAYLYVLWLVGGLAHLLAGLTGVEASLIAGGLIKLPPMLADVAIGAVLYLLVRRWTARRPDTERLALIAAALYVFNPVSWYDSAIWGQTDSVGALVILLGVAALVRGNPEGSAALAVLAGLVKPQFGVVLAPLVGVVLLRRHLLAPGSGPRNRPLAPTALRAWFDAEHGAWRLLSSAVVGIALLLLVITPFSLDVPSFIRRMAETAGGYEWLSVNAYNLWALVGSQGAPPFALGGGWSPDTAPLLGPLPGVVIGAGLLVAAFALGLLRVAWRDDRRSIVLVATFVALAFFVLPTRVHERYLFPVFALLPILAVADRRWLWATVALSLASFINLHGILTIPQYATPNVVGLPLGDVFREPLVVILSVLLHLAVFGFALWRLRPAAADESDTLWSASDSPAPAMTTVRVPTAELPGAGSWAVAWRARLGRLTDVRTVRRDRSAELHGERGGVIDRLDLLLLLLVFLSTLGLRTFRLDEPHSMHFDEVYHARTGIEFLQHWEYGSRSSIYEFTHPHLAKYLIAQGITSLGNNRVTDVAEVGVPVRDAALEPRWSVPEAPEVRNGERLYVLSDEQLVVYQLPSRERLTSIALAGEALALDNEQHVLYVADSSGGMWRMYTTDLDGPGGGIRPIPEQLGRLPALEGGPRKLVFSRGRLLAVGDDGLLLHLDPFTGQELARTSVAGAADVLAAQSEEAEVLVVAAEPGFVVLDAETLDELTTLGTSSPITSLALASEGLDRPTAYGTTGAALQALELPGDAQPRLGGRIDMPNVVSDVVWNPATGLIHVLGRTMNDAAPTVYVAEPRSNAVFADAPLPFEPVALVLDVQPERPAEDRADLLALAPDGRLATVDVGGNSFAWRFPGVLAGALLAVALYLLARFLFARRSVALIAALLVLLDGMFFANARIAMNDTYVALFIVAAMALFAPLWLGRWRNRAIIAGGLLGVGLLLGLALASKWVGVYAIGAVGLLLLLRSALGRLMALVAMIGLSALLGYIAVTPAAGVENPQLNYPFLLLMVGLTAVIAAAIVLRPVRMTADEMRLLIFGPAVLGALVLAAGLLIAFVPGLPLAGVVIPVAAVLAGVLLLLLSGVVYLVFRLAAHWGYGPLTPSPVLGTAPGAAGDGAAMLRAEHVDHDAIEVAPPPPPGWLRPGAGPLGLPWLGALAAITLLPLAVYTASYVPWIELGNRWTAEIPASAGGQTFLDLQVSMYDYHNNLRATHPASSPWWAWPLNLKPVWFEQEGYANDTTAVIYNTGNLVIFWLAIPAVAWAAYQAWRRRSLPLALLSVAIASLWLPWARIDRVAFQYHIFTTLPFSFLALAYFLAELWHGPSARTWLLARASAALAIVGPALLWLLRLPLCAAARVESVNPGSEVCGALDRQLVISDVQVVGLLAAAGGLIFLAALLRSRASPLFWGPVRPLALPLAAVVVLVGLVLVVAGAVVPASPVFEAPLSAPELPALLALALLALPAYYVLRARDPRRFVVGAIAAAAVWFVLWYPNFAGLPLPSRLAQLHLGLLPTWNFAFQFGANQDEPNRAPPDLLSVLMLGAVISLLVVAVMYTVRTWRAERAAEERSLSPLGEAS